MSTPDFLTDILIFLTAAVCIVPLFQRLRASPILGYLAAGVVIGPFGISLIQGSDTVHTLAGFGVVFLMFAIGLELSLVHLRTVWRYIFGLGTLQMLLTSTLFAIVVHLLGAPISTAIIIGAGFAFSSTAFCSQVMTEKGEVSSRYGRVSLSILVLQDLAVVPLLTLVPLLGGSGKTAIIGISLAMLKAVVALIVIMIMGRLLMRPVMRYMSSFRNAELFMAMTLLMILGIGWLTAKVNLSMELGAFLAGVLLAESEYRHQVEADIRPFRGILLGLFFMAIGMSMNIRLVLQHIPEALLTIVGILVTKTLITSVLCRLFRLPWGLSLRIGLLLSQSGEFAFVLFSAALLGGFLNPALGQFLLLVVALTMVTTPLMVALGDKIVKILSKSKTADLKPVAEDVAELGEHVIIAGFGRVGQTIAKMLVKEQKPYIALDLESKRVTHCRRDGLPVFFGDASRLDVLEAAGAERASAAVITLDKESSAEAAVTALRRHFPDLPIFARAKDKKHGQELEKLGADGVVLETLEASLQLGGLILLSGGFPVEEVTQKIETYRHEGFN